MPEGPEFTTMLRAAGLRVPHPRLAVLHAVSEHPHTETDVIIRAARAHLADVSHQTVYDALNAVTAAGLLRRIQPNDLPARCGTRVGDNHHHLVCRRCGAIADVDRGGWRALPGHARGRSPSPPPMKGLT